MRLLPRFFCLQLVLPFLHIVMFCSPRSRDEMVPKSLHSELHPRWEFHPPDPRLGLIPCHPGSSPSLYHWVIPHTACSDFCGRRNYNYLFSCLILILALPTIPAEVACLWKLPLLSCRTLGCLLWWPLWNVKALGFRPLEVPMRHWQVGVSHLRERTGSAGTERNRINSTVFLAPHAVTRRVSQWPVRVTYEPHYIVIHICLSSATQYSAVEYVRLTISWTEEK